MVVKRYKRKDGYVANFYCSNQTGHKVCSPHTHLVSDVEDYVYDAMVKRAYSIEKSKKEGKTNINQKLSEIHSQIEDINARIENLVLNLEQAGAVSLKYINKRIEELDAEKAKLEAENGTWSFEADMLAVPSLYDWEEKSLDEKKAAARSMVKNVVITREGVITVDWRM